MASVHLLSLAINARFPIPGIVKIVNRIIVSVHVSAAIRTYSCVRTTTMRTMMHRREMRRPQSRLKLHDVYACVENMVKVPFRCDVFSVHYRTPNIAKIVDPFDVCVLVPAAIPTLPGP